MESKQSKRERTIRRELLMVRMQEQKIEEAAKNQRPAAWKANLEEKIPEKVRTGLESAFCTGFGLVFDQGRAIIERSYNKKGLKSDHDARDTALHAGTGGRQLRQMNRSAKRSDLLNMAVTTAEGVGLGALGIGMPDVVLFLSMLLKGIYETALHYGFDYESRQEQLLILKMMSASLSTGADYSWMNRQVDKLLNQDRLAVTEEEFKAQLRQTASVFAVDMLLLKFIQGLPVVGIFGGAANPVYYNKVMAYVRLKYKKRYLLKQEKGTSN